MNIELKTGKSRTSLADLEKKPWSAYGQFFQGFVKKTKNYKTSKCSKVIDYVTPLIKAWYDEVIVKILMPRYGIDPTTTPHNFDDYVYLMFRSSSSTKSIFFT
jgi:hypothetical protein